MRRIQLSTLSFSFALLCSIAPVVEGQAESVTAATQPFLTAHPGSRAILHDGKVAAIYGVPLKSDANTVTAAAFVDSFRAEVASALGVDPNDLVLRENDTVTIRNGTMVVYTFTQTMGGLPVHGSIVRVPVTLGTEQRIPYVGVSLARVPSPPPAVTAKPPKSDVAELLAISQLTILTEAASVAAIPPAN